MRWPISEAGKLDGMGYNPSNGPTQRGITMPEPMETEVIKTYEALVDELVAPAPNEPRVQELMEQLGLEYSTNPMQRISLVFEKMNASQFPSSPASRKEDHGLPKHT